MNRTRSWAKLLIFTLFLLLPKIGWANEKAGVPDLVKCQNIKEDTLKDELRKLTRSALRKKKIGDFVKDIVEDAWQANDMDSLIDKVVSGATSDIKSDTGFWSRLKSAWSSSRAKTLVKKVAREAFGSSRFRTGIKELSDKIGTGLTRRMGEISKGATTEALNCLRTYIRHEYSSNVEVAFTDTVKVRSRNLKSRDLDVSGGGVGQHKLAVGGIAAIVTAHLVKALAKKVTKILAKKLTRRIAGKIFTRILGKAATSAVPVVGWILGGGMLAIDLWQSRNGAFPDIKKGLTSSKTKDLFKLQITEVVEKELAQNKDEIADTIANEVYNQWSEFKVKLAELLQLAAEMPELKKIMQHVPPGDLFSLARVTSAIVSIQYIRTSFV